jgi:tRNA A-37 threonylcarbamoyl transferase component Bud32
MVESAASSNAAHAGDGTTRFMKIGRVRVRSRYILLFQHNELSDFASVFRFDGGESLDKPGLATWRDRRRVVLRDTAGEPHTFYLKRYVRPPLRQQIRRILTGRPRVSTAGREWRAISALAEAGVSVPAPAAFGQKMRGWLERRSFLVLEPADGESLERWLPDHWRRRAADSDARRQHRLTRALARAVGAFHAAGFVHRDMYTSHVFVAGLDEAPDAPPRVTFIDLQRVFRPRWRRIRWVVKDLAALYYSTEPVASRTDRLRFWRVYLATVRRGRWKDCVPPRVVAKARRIRRHVKNQRPPAPNGL